MRSPNTVRSPSNHTLMAVATTLTTLTWRLSGPKFDTDFPEVSVAEIEDAAEQVHELIAQLAVAVDPHGGYAESRIQAIVGDLRLAGRVLAHAMFQSQEEKVRRLILTEAIHHVLFTVPEATFSFPLEFAVFEDENGGEFFLGDRLLVVRRPAVDPQFISYGESDVILDEILPKWEDEPTAGYAEDHTLDSACSDAGRPSRPDDEEVYALAEIIGLEHINHLPPLTDASSRKRVFEDWLSTWSDVLHFNCHTVLEINNRGKPIARHLKLREHSPIASEDFRFDDAMGFNDNAFIFLNACNSAYGPIAFKGSIAIRLIQLDAASVACTTGAVDDTVGLLFARKFYRNVKTGMNVGDAIIVARKKLNAELGHPLANLYTLVGAPDFFVKAA